MNPWKGGISEGSIEENYGYYFRGILERIIRKVYWGMLGEFLEDSLEKSEGILRWILTDRDGKYYEHKIWLFCNFAGPSKKCLSKKRLSFHYQSALSIGNTQEYKFIQENDEN